MKSPPLDPPVADSAPGDAILTAYDEQHLVTYLRLLDARSFAWEYLRRNPDFARERANLERAARRRPLSAAALEAFSQRWGVRFCKYPRYPRLQRCYLDAPCPAECDRAHRSPPDSR